jgi:hypothetical protein
MKFLSIQFLVAIQLLTVIDGFCQTLEWAKTFGGSYDDYSHTIVVDRTGNSYTTGYFSGAVDFDPGPGVFEMANAGGYFDSYVSKLNPDGEFVWARGFHGDGDVESFDVAVDGDKNVYVVGEFYGTVDFDPGSDSLIFYVAEPHAGFVVKLDSMGDLLWASRFGNGWLCSIRSIDLDREGNVYVTGMFADSLDIDPGPGTYMLTDPGDHMDIFLCKLDADGNFLWGKHLLGTDDEAVPKVAVNSEEDVLVSGNFTETLEFNLGGVSSTLTSYGEKDSFVCKYDSNGELIWAKQIGGSSQEHCNALVCDSLDNIYLAGWFSGSSDFDPAVSVYTMNALEEFDIYVLKLSSGGEFLWCRQIVGGNLDDFAHSLAVSPNQDLIIAGRFEDTIDFDPGSGYAILTSADNMNTFVLGLDEFGRYEWAFTTGGDRHWEGGNKVAVDGYGAIFITGQFFGTVDFDPSSEIYSLTAPPHEIFVQKVLPPIKYNGVSDLSKQTDWLYPNPTSGMVYLKSGTSISGVSVMNALGSTVSEISSGGNEIDLSQLPNGIYLVRYTTDLNSFLQKVNVHH